jgi:7-cyano-7-deazaguanine synthase
MTAIVVLSGGQDSAICAAIARQEHNRVIAVTFDYNQRHRVEIESAIEIAKELRIEHEIVVLGSVLKGSSPLVDQSQSVGKYTSTDKLPDGVEPTFVPARNALFLTIAANRATVFGASEIYTGVCQADYGGYYDCREDFINDFAKSLGLGISGDPNQVKIVTPLMHLSKSESILLGSYVLGDRFDLVMGLTHTCYDGVSGGCGECHACLIRDRGFHQAGIVDPIWKYRGGNN